MTRRKGVIAALATVCAAFANQTKERKEITGTATTTGVTNVWASTSYASAITLKLQDKGDPGYGFSEIIVEYGSRKVTLSAKQIWEALEAK